MKTPASSPTTNPTPSSTQNKTSDFIDHNGKRHTIHLDVPSPTAQDPYSTKEYRELWSAVRDIDLNELHNISAIISFALAGFDEERNPLTDDAASGLYALAHKLEMRLKQAVVTIL
jgi:hypothetical protein